MIKQPTVILGFILNATTQTTLTINSFKVLMILGFFSHAAVKLYLSILWKIKKNISSVSCDSNNKSKKPDDKDGSLLLKPSEHLKHSVNQFNNVSSNTVSSKYYDIDELQNLKITNKSKSLSLFHINSCSLWWPLIPSRLHKWNLWYYCYNWN